MLQGKEILKMGSGAVGASSSTLNEYQLFPEAWRGVRPDFTWIHHVVEQHYFIATELEAFKALQHWWPGAVGWAGAHFDFQVQVPHSYKPLPQSVVLLWFPISIPEEMLCCCRVRKKHIQHKTSPGTTESELFSLFFCLPPASNGWWGETTLALSFIVQVKKKGLVKEW